MVDKLILKKDGKIDLVEWVYDEETEEGEMKTTPFEDDGPADILRFLENTIELEKGYTLRDYFKLIDNHKSLTLVVDGYINVYLKEFDSAPDNNCVCEDIDYIILYKVYDFEMWDDCPNISNYCAVSGKNKTEDINYSLSFIPLKELLDIPIIIDKSLTSYVNYSDKKDFGKNDELSLLNQKSFSSNFSLYEFIKTPIYELSFYGTPTETEEKNKELGDIVDEVNKDIESGKIENYKSIDNLGFEI